MTQQNHPITPPPELVQQWREQLFSYLDPAATVAVHELSCLAAQWGADQELEACCEWLASKALSERKHPELRAARRPKPPSLKRVALLQLDVITKDLTMHGLGCDLSQIRRALESIPDHASEGGFNG